MAAIVVASNILVQFLFGQWLTWGAFTYPLAFLVTDIMNRVYGVSAARRVVFAGFLVGVACSLIGTQIMGEFGPLVTLRIALGSGIAFLTAQLLDVAIFDRMRASEMVASPCYFKRNRIFRRHRAVLHHRLLGLAVGHRTRQ
jgi:uncharacterized integral membrane protein (TIGR00697 family)